MVFIKNYLIKNVEKTDENDVGYICDDKYDFVVCKRAVGGRTRT